MNYKKILKDTPRDEIARAVGFSTSYVSSVLSGYHTPSLDLERKLIELAGEIEKEKKMTESHTAAGHIPPGEKATFLAGQNTPPPCSFTDSDMEKIEAELKGLPDSNFVKLSMVANLCRQGRWDALGTVTSAAARDRVHKMIDGGE